MNGRITANENVDILGNQVHPVVQMLFSNNDANFQDDIAPTHTRALAHTHTHTHTQPELFGPGLKRKKIHLNAFSGQHDRQT
jgi:hypothetical protein